LSHPSKIEEIRSFREQNYKAYLYYVCTDNPEINKSRIENRQQKGGHYVSPERVEKRYRDSLKNIVPLLSYVDQAYFFDNSSRQELFAEIKEDKLVIHNDDIPNWFFEYVIDLIFE
jgi:predicted ABC-type ATPase